MTFSLRFAIAETVDRKTFVCVTIDKSNYEISEISFIGKGCFGNADSPVDDLFIASVYNVQQQITGKEIPPENRYVAPRYTGKSYIKQIEATDVFHKMHKGRSSLTRNDWFRMMEIQKPMISLNDVLHSFYKTNRAYLRFESDEDEDVFLRLIEANVDKNRRSWLRTRVYAQLIGQAMRSEGDSILNTLPDELRLAAIGSYLVAGDEELYNFFEKNLATKPEHNKELLINLVYDILNHLDNVKPRVTHFFKDTHAEVRDNFKKELTAQIGKFNLNAITDSICKFAISITNGNSKRNLASLLTVLDENQQQPNADECQRIRALGKADPEALRKFITDKIYTIVIKPNLGGIPIRYGSHALRSGATKAL